MRRPVDLVGPSHRRLAVALVVMHLLARGAVPMAAAAAAESPAANPSPGSVASPESTTSPTAPTLAVEPLRIGQRWRGQLDGGAPARFGFTLATPEHLRLRLVQPPDADVEVSLEAEGGVLLRQRALEPGAELEIELWLPAGANVLTLRPTRAAEGRHRLLVGRLDPFVVPADAEPNDDPAHAREVPPSLRWAGGPAGAEPDLDGFWLPALTIPGDIRARVDGEPPLIRLYADAGRTEQLDLDAAGDGVLVASGAPTGRPLYLEVEAEAPYGLELEAPGWAPADDVLAPPVELELEVDQADGPVCPSQGASLPGRLTILDVGAEPLELELRTASSHPGWQLQLDRSALSVGSGESVAVPASVRVAAGSCPSGDVAISVAAVAPDGGMRSTTLTLPQPDERPFPRDRPGRPHP